MVEPEAEGGLFPVPRGIPGRQRVQGRTTEATKASRSGSGIHTAAWSRYQAIIHSRCQSSAHTSAGRPPRGRDVSAAPPALM
ncbi:hypothetical protein CcI156_22685 [Frankia sp. CcI156]|nr:hypothetical protein CcI6DRAFT_04847 [Frankia sp. CcI6]EYT89588.1 hypothetical protein ThrDRAFT_04799 [Frankia casuarinae]OHV56171.1 hypothetical protein CgIS1_22650 [Frankia sp. CgIS1]ONH21850.1 hypothetical protein CcI156_22685 [Frankia sp. CcI156]ORT93188.1 hypothetical protein UK99_20165 [Frankia casuarinae]